MKEQALIKKLEYDWIEALKRYETVQKVINTITGVHKVNFYRSLALIRP